MPPAGLCTYRLPTAPPTAPPTSRPNCRRPPAPRQVGYHLRTFSLQRGSIGAQLQTVALPNCPFVTSVQFAPLNFAVLIGYGRCQQPETGGSGYAVLRCIQFNTRSSHRLRTEVPPRRPAHRATAAPSLDSSRITELLA